jgi:hypothetical protein
LTKDCGDFEIIQQEIENAATTTKKPSRNTDKWSCSMKNISLLRLLSKNQATAHTSSSPENINNSHIHALARNQARLSEIVDRSSPGPVSNATVNLPTVSIPIFKGNYLEWTSFHNLLVSLIHNNEKLPTSQKLHRLKSSLKGDAASSLKHLCVSDATYEPTWEELKRKYDNKNIIIQSHIDSFFRSSYQTTHQHHFRISSRLSLPWSYENLGQYCDEIS